MSIKFNTNQGDLHFDDVGKDENDWFTIKSQSVTFSKVDFYVDEFNKDFPQYTLLGNDNNSKFEFLTQLCTRKTSMQNWYTGVGVKYANSTQLPLYLKDKVSPDKFKAVQDKLLEMKDKLASQIIKRNEIAKKYSEDLKIIEAEERRIVAECTRGDNIMKIVNLNSTCLPLSIQMLIQGYTPVNQDTDLADNKRRFAQECLAKFKIGLLELNDRVENLDVDALINEIDLK